METEELLVGKEKQKVRQQHSSSTAALPKEAVVMCSRPGYVG